MGSSTGRELGRRINKREKYPLVSNAEGMLCSRRASLLCGITKGSALASGGISREACLVLHIREHFLSKLSQDSIGCFRRGLRWVTGTSDPQDPF